MASIFNQDIGLNYKGIITLGSTINQNLSGTLQYLTDGDGNNLPLQVSTTGLQFNAIETIYRNAAGTNIAMNVWGNLGRVAIGGLTTNYTPSASLQVRGDGTNPIFTAENNAGTSRFSIPNAGAITTNSDITIPENNFFRSGSATFSGISSAAALYWAANSANGRLGVSATGVFMDYGGTAKSNTSGTVALATLTSGFGAAAGSANYRPLSIAYTINNTGVQTGNTTGIFLNATETALNSMTHNLMDLQVGGQSRLRYTPTANSGLQITRTDNAYVSVTLNNNGITVHQNLGVTSNYYVATVGSVLYTVNSWTIGSNAVNFARLHVRGDGTNPIARFETSAGGASYIINSTGTAHTFTGSIDVSDVVNVAATRGYFWTNRGGIATSGDGIILLRNNNNTDFNRLNFGGNTSSFPSLKRNTIALEARLADDSDFTFIQGKLRTETNFTSEPAVMASGYIVLYDLDGTAYKVLATAL